MLSVFFISLFLIELFLNALNGVAVAGFDCRLGDLQNVSYLPELESINTLHVKDLLLFLRKRSCQLCDSEVFLMHLEIIIGNYFLIGFLQREIILFPSMKILACIADGTYQIMFDIPY